MTFDEFQIAAARTSRTEPRRERILVQALGLNGEAGEVADLVKKWAWHGKDLTPSAMCDELGDLLWYMADLASAMGLSFSDVARANVEKLHRRYPSGFTPDGGIRNIP